MNLDALSIGANTLVYHQPIRTSACICGWGELGRSFAEHQMNEVLAALAAKKLKVIRVGTAPTIPTETYSQRRAKHRQTIKRKLHHTVAKPDVRAVLNAAKIAGHKTDTGYEFNTNEQATLEALAALRVAGVVCFYVPKGFEAEHGARLVNIEIECWECGAVQRRAETDSLLFVVEDIP